MLLKEQKAKFSFLASDEEDEEDRKEERLKGLRGDGRERRGGSGDGTGPQQVGSEEGDVGEKEQRRKGERDKDVLRGKNQGKEGEGRKSPSVLTASTASSSTFPTNVLPEEPESQAVLPGPVVLKEDSPKASSIDTPSLVGAHTPPYNGQSQVIHFHLSA